MRVPTAATLALTLAACTQAPVTDQSAAACWKHVTTAVPGVSNTLFFCTRGPAARMTIYYPNDASRPTVCTQAGSIVQATPESLEGVMEGGTCLNGRTLAAGTYLCERKSKASLACSFKPDPPNGDERFEFLFAEARWTPALPVSLPYPPPESYRHLAKEASTADSGVHVRCNVTSEGLCVSATLLQSSGIEDLDQAVIENAVKAWRFIPATRNGDPVEGTFDVTQGLKGVRP